MRININDKKNKCDHEFKIPGLDASLCGKCGHWVITDLKLIHELKYGRKKKRKRGQAILSLSSPHNLIS